MVTAPLSDFSGSVLSIRFKATVNFENFGHRVFRRGETPNDARFGLGQ